jgi:hypothetical protein
MWLLAAILAVVALVFIGSAVVLLVIVSARQDGDREQPLVERKREAWK